MTDRRNWNAFERRLIEQGQLDQAKANLAARMRTVRPATPEDSQHIATPEQGRHYHSREGTPDHCEQCCGPCLRKPPHGEGWG